jgi:sugar-specific transcriptional regulator TrmB
MDILQQLRDFGFSDKESKLYLLLAECGKATATSLSRRSKLSRSSVYFVLDSLRKRGLVSAETKNGTTYFAPCDPQVLKEELKCSQQEIAKKILSAEKLAQQLLPFFRAKQFHVPKLHFIEGRQAVLKTLSNREDLWHESMLKTDSTWWGFEDGAMFTHYKSWFEHIWSKFKTLREERLNVRVFSNAPVAAYLEGRFPRTLLRPLPTGYNFSTTLWLMGDFIILISSREKPHYMYQLEDPALAENLRVIFRLLWKE